MPELVVDGEVIEADKPNRLAHTKPRSQARSRVPAVAGPMS